MGELSSVRYQQGLRLVSSIVQAFSETTSNYRQVIDVVATEISRAIPDLCVVSLRDNDALVTVAAHDNIAEANDGHRALLHHRLARDEARLAALAMSKGPVFRPVIDYDEILADGGEQATERLRKLGARGMMIVPLAFRGELHGIMTCVRYRAEHRALDELDFEIFKDLGKHAALAISNARLFERLEHTEMLRSVEESAVQASQLVDAIVENIPNMVFVKDALDLTFVRFNRAGEQLLGVPREQLLGKSDNDLFPPDEAEFFIAKDRETIAKRTMVDIIEEPIHTPRGTRWLHTKKVPLLDRDGVPRYLLGISEDITERKENELALRAALNATDAAHRELDSFAYSVAHDLRAPLRGIDGFSLAILEDYGDNLDAGAKQYLTRVRQSAQRMAALIDDLLALSRVTRNDLAHEPVDLSVIARAAIARLSRDSSRVVDVTIQAGLVVAADRRMIETAIDNLIDNAWKFTSKRPRSKIELGRREDGTFFVRDNGAGFEMEFVHKLFGVFQRLHTEAEFPGLGIGLVTVARIVERHGGRVWAEGGVDRGATFYFVLGEP